MIRTVIKNRLRNIKKAEATNECDFSLRFCSEICLLNNKIFIIVIYLLFLRPFSFTLCMFEIIKNFPDN